MPRLLLLLSFVIAVLVGSKLAEAQDAPRGITVVSVLAMAKDEAERAPTEDARLSLRMRVSWAMESTKTEGAFGSYVADSRAAWRERWRDPNYEQTLKNFELFRQAKDAFLSGDVERSKELLQQCRPVSHPYDCLREGMLDWRFLNWEIESENLSAALHRLNTTSWRDQDARIGVAAVVSEAYFKSNRRQEAVEILRRLRADSPHAKRLLGIALWKVGAVEEGRAMLRDAVTAALAEAKTDVTKSLPVDLARIQLVIGDRDGALQTLASFHKLAAPLEYDPKALSTPNSLLTTLTRASFRWCEARDKIAGIYALAGLDADAVALMDEPAADQTQVLRGIVRGHAARGDFDAAFQTLEHLRGPLTVPERPLTILPGPKQSGPYEVRTRTLSDDAGHLMKPLLCDLARIAAHQARPDVVEKAFARERALPRTFFRVEWADVLKDHAKAGHSESALRLALSLDGPSTRINALTAIAEGMSGLSSTVAYDPLLPQ